MHSSPTVHYADLAEFLESAIYFHQWEISQVQVSAKGWLEAFAVKTPVWVGDTTTSDLVLQSVAGALRQACQQGVSLDDLALGIAFVYPDGNLSYRVESDSLSEQLEHWRHVQEFQSRQLRLF